MRMRLLIFFIVTNIYPLFAQTNTQLWFEYMLELPFANSYLFENTIAFSTVLNSSRWRSLDYKSTIDYTLNQNIDLLGGVTFSYVEQTSDYASLEIRPMIGTRFHFTPNQRVHVRLLIRIEQRNFKNLETGKWQENVRPRFRLESIAPLNRRTNYDDRLLYGIADFEWLMVTGDDVEERFAIRVRGRIGLGYRINYKYRIEILYMIQQSRNKINEDFDTTNNIFRFRFKHNLR